MNRRFRTLLVSVVLIAMLSGLFCSCHKEAPVRIAVASDLHFISPELVQDYGFLDSVMHQSDGKATQISSRIVDAFVEDVLDQKYSAVVLSGDLTLNGEPESHIELASRLRPLLEAGIPVYVIPGNHDINHAAYRFTDVGVEPIAATGPQQYEDIWLDFGYGNALYQDPMSDSYMTPITEKLWLLAIDSNTGSTGTVRTSTLEWMEGVLQTAMEKGALVISTTHQNVLVHNERFTFGYVLNNASKVQEMLRRYDVKLNLSGHLHIQSIASEDGLTEIDASSLCVYPLQYGVLEIGKDSISYNTREIPNKDLKEIAKETFDSCTLYKNLSSLDLVPESDALVIRENALRLNREYFMGCMSPTSKDVLDLFSRYDNFRFGGYLLSFAGDTTDNRRFYMKLD